MQVNEEEPCVMWLSGLHIPESYLTALVQATCRKNGWPLDHSTLYTQVTQYRSEDEIKERPAQGESTQHSVHKKTNMRTLRLKHMFFVFCQDVMYQDCIWRGQTGTLNRVVWCAANPEFQHLNYPFSKSFPLKHVASNSRQDASVFLFFSFLIRCSFHLRISVWKDL